MINGETSRANVSLDALYAHGVSLYGRPYIWGGDGSDKTYKGYDCSGLLVELLRMGKAIPRGDFTAQALYNLLKTDAEMERRTRGSVAFFGSSLEKITHCSWLCDGLVMLHAAGGTKWTRTPWDAMSIRASVKLEPLTVRKDLVALLFPSYGKYQ